MHTRTRSRRTWWLSGATGIAVGVFVGAIVALTGVVIPLQPAQADTSSAVTIKASDQDSDIKDSPLPDLAVTVSQTKDLVSQGVIVSWTGGKKSTIPGPGTGGENFLQIAQCWDDDPNDPARPDRTTCQYGGFFTPGAARDGFTNNAAAIAPEDDVYTAPSTDFAVPNYTSIPFRSVDGTVVASVVDNKKVPGVDVNTNPFFTKYTSNEITWAGSGASGEGSAKFEIQTAMQATGLGCGAPVDAQNGDTTPRSCWLVVIPRGVDDFGEQHITKSGLTWNAWKHSIAVKLDFSPLALTCQIGAAERQISGSELAAGAIASWQPTLCNSTGGSIFTISNSNDSDAALAASGTGGAPLALTSRPLDTSITGGDDPLSYAPIALTGVSVSFAIDRHPTVAPDTPADVLDKAGLPYDTLNLTPRLLAKLLTNSYVDSLPPLGDKSHIDSHNARNLTVDPDFLLVNDKAWQYENLSSPSLGDLLVPQGRSDAAWQLWNYVLSDPAAVAFLNGEPDQWGMVVNPYSEMDATRNPTGSALDLPRDGFPKADPIEAAGSGAAGSAPINLVTWRPYTNDFDTSGYLTLRGDGQELGLWDPNAAPVPKYGKSVRSVPGLQTVLGLTDTASAAKYQIVSAALLNPAGKYVAPSTESLLVASAAMTANPAQPQVYGFNPKSEIAKAASGAYPLTMPVYAAANPALEDPSDASDPTGATLRSDYANFIRYAATAGQSPGATAGLLPAGYAPLPQGWRDQALAAADAIQTGVAPAIAPPGPAHSNQKPPTNAPKPPALAAADQPAPAVANPNPSSAPPAASGPTAPALLGAATPADPQTGSISAALPASVLAGLASAGLVPILTRIRRRP